MIYIDSYSTCICRSHLSMSLDTLTVLAAGVYDFTVFALFTSICFSRCEPLSESSAERF